MSMIARLPSQLIYPAATSFEAGDLLLVQKAGEQFLRAIDPTTLGYLTPGAGSIVTADIASEAVTAVTSAYKAETVLTNKNQNYAVVTHTRTVPVACHGIWTIQIDWEHDRSQGVQAFYLIAEATQTVGGVTTTVRFSWIQSMDGIPAQVVIPEKTVTGTCQTTVGGTTYNGTTSTTIPEETRTVDWGALKLMGVTTMVVALWLPAGSNTLVVNLKRDGTHSSAGKTLQAVSTLVEHKR